jgi:hypothetical protein
MPGGSSPALPTLAEVDCSGSGVQAKTPSVAAEPDGIHIRVENRTSQMLSYQLGHIVSGDESQVDHVILASGLSFAPGSVASGGDGLIHPGEQEESAWLVPPGQVAVLCGPSGRPIDSDEVDVGFLNLVDRRGLYHSARLDCRKVRNYEISLPIIPTEPPRFLLRGIREQDVFEYVGYPKQPEPAFRVVRAGRTVAIVSGGGGPSGRGLLIVCSDSGLSRASG